jgi:hypothetical protein
MRQGGRRPKVPASLADMDLDRVRRVMFRSDGNVTRAAKALKVSSADLRRLTWRNPTLIMDALEQAHRLVDKAEEKLRAALYGDHQERSLRAATFILSHRLRLASAAGLVMAAAAPTASILRRLRLRRSRSFGRAMGAIVRWRANVPEARVAFDPHEDRRRQ